MAHTVTMRGWPFNSVRRTPLLLISCVVYDSWCWTVNPTFALCEPVTYEAEALVFICQVAFCP